MYRLQYNWRTGHFEDAQLMSMQELSQAQLEQIQESAPWLAKTCVQLLRESPDTLSAYLTTVCNGTTVGTTRATGRCHVLALDGNQRPRTADLAKFLAKSIIQYCIPRREIEGATKLLREKSNPRDFVALEMKAKELFTHLTRSGEGGELLLYTLVESILSLPQLLCKMPLKTSGQVHYHGVDGVHGTVDADSGTLALYWGESKLHADVNKAIRECFESVAPFLLAAGGSSAAHNRDLHLLRDNLDLNDPILEAAFSNYLNPDHPKYKQLQFRAACLIGFDSDAYPTLPNMKFEQAVKGEIESGLSDLWAKVEKHVKKQQLETFVLEVFCLPFPDVDAFRGSFSKELGITP